MGLRDLMGRRRARRERVRRDREIEDLRRRQAYVQNVIRVLEETARLRDRREG